VNFKIHICFEASQPIFFQTFDWRTYF